MFYLSSFIRLTWLTVGACPVFVAVYTEREIRVSTQKRTVLISGHVSSIHVRIVQQLLPVPFRSVPERSGFSSIPCLASHFMTLWVGLV